MEAYYFFTQSTAKETKPKCMGWRYHAKDYIIPDELKELAKKAALAVEKRSKQDKGRRWVKQLAEDIASFDD